MYLLDLYSACWTSADCSCGAARERSLVESAVSMIDNIIDDNTRHTHRHLQCASHHGNKKGCEGTTGCTYDNQAKLCEDMTTPNVSLHIYLLFLSLSFDFTYSLKLFLLYRIPSAYNCQPNSSAYSTQPYKGSIDVAI